jgi:hypothetical protein
MVSFILRNELSSSLTLHRAERQKELHGEEWREDYDGDGDNDDEIHEEDYSEEEGYNGEDVDDMGSEENDRNKYSGGERGARPPKQKETTPHKNVDSKRKRAEQPETLEDLEEQAKNLLAKKLKSRSAS